MTNTGGDVYLASKGDIVGANANSTVKGDLISLQSDNGGIGAANVPLLINSGTGSGRGSQPRPTTAFILKAAGDLNLITVSSTAGDVYIEAGTGSILDGVVNLAGIPLPRICSGHLEEPGVVRSADGSPAALSAGVLKTDRKPDIWNEYDPALGIDVNVGNSITLKALHGAIGQTTGTLTVDLRIWQS